MIKVSNIVSNKGNEIANQFIISDHNGTGIRYFQSYNSIIVKQIPQLLSQEGKTYLDEIYWNYSKTTSKYRSIFLGETTKETQDKIKSGEYILTNLN